MGGRGVPQIVDGLIKEKGGRDRTSERPKDAEGF